MHTLKTKTPADTTRVNVDVDEARVKTRRNTLGTVKVKNVCFSFFKNTCVIAADDEVLDSSHSNFK